MSERLHPNDPDEADLLHQRIDELTVALERSEERYRRTVEHAPEAIVVLDVEAGRFVTVNAEAERLFDLSRDELLELGPIDVSPPVQPDGRPSREAAEEYIERAVTGETPVFVWNHRRRDGSTVPCETRLLRLPGEGGRVLVRGSLTDVSGRGDRWGAALASMQDGLIVLDTEAAVVEVNARWSQILGFSREDVVGVRPPYPWWPESGADRARIDEVAAEVLDHGGGGEFDLVFRHRAGHAVPVIFSVTRITDVAGNAQGFVGTVKDATERHRGVQETGRLLRQLADERDRQSAFLSSLQDGFFAVDLDGTITAANDRFCEIVGYPKGRVVGARSPHPWSPPPDPASTDALRDAFFRLKPAERLELDLSLVHSDGRDVPVLITLAPLFAADRAVGAVGTVKDMTERRRAADLATRLRRTTLGLASTETLDDVAAIVMDEGLATLGQTTGFLRVVTDDGSAIEIVGSRGYPAALIERWRRIALDATTPGSDCVRTGQAIMLPSPSAIRERYPGAVEGFDAAGAAAAAFIPVPGEAGTQGVIGMTFSAPRELDEDEVGLLEALARLTGQAFDRARHYEWQVREQERSGSLAELATALSSTTTMSEMLPTLVSSAARAAEADGATVALREGDARAFRLVAASGAFAPLAARVPEVDERSPFGITSLRGEPGSWGSLDDLDEASPGIVERYAPWPFRSLACLNLSHTRGGPVLGLGFTQGRSLGPHDRAFLARIGEICRDALQRATSHDRERRARELAERATERLSRLVALTESLSASLSVDEVVERATDGALNALGADAALIAVPAGKRLRVASTRGSGVPGLEIGARTSLDDDLPVAEAASTGLTIVLGAGRELVERYRATGREPAGFETEVWQPLVHGGRTLGVLAVFFRDGWDPVAEDRGLLSSIADTCALAMERARLFEEEAQARAASDRSRSRIERIRAASGDVAAAISESDVADAVMAAAMKLSDAPGARLVLSDADRSALRVVGQVGAVMGAPTSPGWPVEGTAIGEVFRTGDVVVAGSRREIEDRFPDSAAIMPAVRSYVCLPLVAGRSVGVLALAFLEEDAVTRDDLALLVPFAAQAAIALERARLFEAERKARLDLELVQSVSASLASAITPQEVASALVEAGMPAVGASGGSMTLVRGSILEPSIHSGFPAEVVAALDEMPPHARHPVADAASTGHRILVGSPEEARGRYPAFADLHQRFGLDTMGGSWAALPLASADEVLGVLFLSFPEAGPFTVAREMALAALGHQGAVALERAMLHAAEHEVASVLQEGLLPTALRSHGRARVAARYLPAETAVGGDWFEVLDLPRDRLGLAVGDVVGKGVAAAIAMGQLRSGMRALALDGRNAVEVLRSLDDFAARTEGAFMSTAAYVEMDLLTGGLQYASAGHPPPLIVGSSGHRFLLAARRPPLAVDIGGVGVESAPEKLAPGETLILYTDGLVERRGGMTIDEGMERLASHASELADRGPDSMAERLIEALLSNGADDDAAIVCVRFEPGPAPPTTIRFPAQATELARMRADLLRWLEAAGASEVERHEILLAANEACANAIEHANATDPTDVELRARLDEGQVIVSVEDSGVWKQRGTDPGRGRGIPLMRATVDDVDLERSDRGTVVTLRRTLDPAARRRRIRVGRPENDLGTR